MPPDGRAAQVRCPLCGSREGRSLGIIEPGSLIAAWNRTFGIDITAELAGADAAWRFECARCQLQSFHPSSLAGSDLLYAELQRQPWYYMERKWEHEAALEDLSGCGRVLEIGCGAGDFIARARDERGIEIEGIELSGKAVAEAKSRGLPVELKSLQDVAAHAAGRYDGVCSFQVLEHVTDPRRFLELSCTLLKPGARLLVGVPNADGFLKHQHNLLDMPPHHMTRWPRRTLAFLPTVFPLQLKRLESEPLAEYHVDGFVQAYVSALVGAKLSAAISGSPLQHFLSKVLRLTGLRRILKGHTHYAMFIRT